AVQLSQMALNAAEAAEELKIEPKVALLSYSTKGSGGDGDDLKLIRSAVDLVKKAKPKLVIDGEMQFDAAVNPSAAKKKCPDSLLKGEANVIIFPNLVSANIFCHGMMQFSEMVFEFTMLKGMQKPVAILGRSTPLETVRNIILSCAMEVNAKK
ncbi:phosphate acetyltransferase, partial [Candidatus Woesearchaeota archaeon]|nr:phosphate acetyltransferase [Candidatus Woesearchaeota archaeon]